MKLMVIRLIKVLKMMKSNSQRLKSWLGLNWINWKIQELSNYKI